MDIDGRLQDTRRSLLAARALARRVLGGDPTDARLGAMLTGPVAGRLLELLVWAERPRRSRLRHFSGHATLSMAAGLTPDGHIDTLELDPNVLRWRDPTSIAARGPTRSRFTSGRRESIATLAGSFDFVFMDADKTGYIDYYEAVLPRLTEHGLIVVDNTLHAGHVFEDGDTIAAFNAHVAADPRSVAGAVDRKGRHDRDSSRVNSFGTHAPLIPETREHASLDRCRFLLPRCGLGTSSSRRSS